MSIRPREPEHNYRIEDFEFLPSVIMGRDNMCTCSCADRCPLGKTGSELRCTLKELQRADDEARARFAHQGGYET